MSFKLKERDFKFSPTLKAEVAGELIIQKKKKNKDKYNQLNIFGLNNTVTKWVLDLRKKVEESFGSKKFAQTYQNYVLLLEALFTTTMSYMLADEDYESSQRLAIKDYIEGAQYRRLPYVIKNTIVYRFQEKISITEVADILNKANISKEMFEELSSVLMQKTKLVSLKMQEHLTQIASHLKG